MIDVTYSNEWLTVSGTSADPDNRSPVKLRAGSAETTLEDNNREFIDMPTNNVAPNRFIDVRDVTTAQLWLFATPGVGEVKVLGSEGEDGILSRTDGLATLNGGRGDDRFTIQGTGDSKIVGGRGNDIFNGGVGNDTMWGGRGDDEMVGGGGVDVLMYSGNFADYTLSIVNGRYQIVDNVGKEGTDVFTGFTTVQFADQAVAVDPTLTNIQVVFSGANVTLNGNAATDDDLVRISIYRDSVRIYDNDAGSTRYDFEADEYLATFDGRSFLQSGIELRWGGTVDKFGRGTRFADEFDFSGDTEDRVSAKGGDDLVETGGGNDWISGGRGNDSIDGGLGDDTVFYSGNRADYDLSIVEGNYVITHLNGGTDGSDTFTNVENVTFADETITVDSPSDLTATVAGTRLIVEGEVGGTRMTVRPGRENVPLVLDEGELDTFIDLEEVNTPFTRVDLRGVTGENTLILNYQTTYTRFFGSEQSDWFLGFAGGDALVQGLGGDDRLSGGDGNDSLYGGLGDDDLGGGKGDDLLHGGNGDDRIEGDEGDDIMILRNNFDQYVFTDLGNGEYQVEHAGGTGRDGLDEFTGIESIQFSDQTVLVDDLVF